MKANVTTRVIILSILLMAGFVINAGYVASAQADTEEFKMSVSAETDEEWNEFKDAMWRERTPTIEEMMEAWERAGKPDGFRIITVASEAIDSTGEPEQFGVIVLTYDEYEQYGWFRPTTAQIDWAFRDTAKITPEEQLKIWADEYEAEQEHIEELWEEYKELTKRDGSDPEYFARKVELDHLRAAEAAESEPTIVYSVIDGDTIQLQNDERSIEDCNKAIELNPNGADAYNYRGVAYTDLKQYERAIEDFNKTIELNSSYVEAYYWRGAAYDELKQYERAIEDFNRVIGLNPNYLMVYAYYGRGTAYIELEQYERAIDDYNKAIELDPNCADVYYNRDLAIGKLKKQKLTPGFEAVFAITGFLAVAYLLKSRKSNGGSKGSL